MQKTMHIGLIGGIGPAATEFYYRGLIARYTRAQARLELTIATADVRELSQNLATRDSKRQAEIFARLIEQLAAAVPQTGARPSACICRTAHNRRQYLVIDRIIHIMYPAWA